MAEEHQEIRSVNWNEVFSFTQIFKCFRMAIHPSKLALCAATLILLLAGGWLLDGVWGWGNGYVCVGEIAGHATMNPDDFNRQMQTFNDGRLAMAANLKAEAMRNAHNPTEFDGILRAELERQKATSPHQVLPGVFAGQLDTWNKEKEGDYRVPEGDQILKEAQDKKTSWSRLVKDAGECFDREQDKIEDLLKRSVKEAENKIKGQAVGKDEAMATLEKQKAIAEQALSKRRLQFRTNVLKIRGTGISNALLTYEWNCVRGAMSAAVRGEFTSGLKTYQGWMEGRMIAPMANDMAALQGPALDGERAGAQANNRAAEAAGVFVWALMAYRGIVWLAKEHWVYAIIYLAFALALISLLGGAVHRIAALHFAREEKISMVQALKFSSGKFLSFFMAPLIPIAIILVLGVLLTLGGLLLSIPIFGDIIVGLLFFLALLMGLGIAFLLVGLISGGSLMYPTIAVEGSDSFDAISRSYSYVFARPWRAILYGLVALVYGAVTYAFVRVFALLALASTHYFTKWGTIGGGQALAPEADKLDVLWTAPSYDRLWGMFSWDAMSGFDSVGAVLIGIWVLLLAAMVGGYLLSFAASSTTVIYFLLRRKVDATDLDDVYIEEAPQEPAPVAAVEAQPEAPAAPAAAEAPAATPPEENKPA